MRPAPEHRASPGCSPPPLLPAGSKTPRRPPARPTRHDVPLPREVDDRAGATEVELGDPADPSDVLRAFPGGSSDRLHLRWGEDGHRGARSVDRWGFDPRAVRRRRDDRGFLPRLSGGLQRDAVDHVRADRRRASCQVCPGRRGRLSRSRARTEPAVPAVGRTDGSTCARPIRGGRGHARASPIDCTSELVGCPVTLRDRIIILAFAAGPSELTAPKMTLKTCDRQLELDPPAADRRIRSLKLKDWERGDGGHTLLLRRGLGETPRCCSLRLTHPTLCSLPTKAVTALVRVMG